MRIDLVFIRAVAAALAGLLLTLPSYAAELAYPSKPIRLVVPFPAGGSLDVVARAIGQKLTMAWGQPVIIDNRPGAGGNIGADLVAKSAPDGYTILEGALSTHAVNVSLYSRMPYDPVKDFAPITLVAVTPNVLVLNPSVPANTVARADRLRQGESGQARLRLGQQRQRRSSRRRAVQGRSRRRHGARSVQGQRARDAGPARRPDPADVRQPGQLDAAGARRQAQGARGHDGAALAAGAGSADARRERAARLRHLYLVGLHGAGRHAEGHHRQVECRSDPHPQYAGDAGVLRAAGRASRRRARPSSSRR